MSGKEFMEQFVTTDSGYLEHIVFLYPDEEVENLDMGNVLGDGFYVCVTSHESDHYQNDDYCDGVDYYMLKDNAVIYVEDGCSKNPPSFFKTISKKYDALYDPKEEAYLGMVVYNDRCLEYI